MVMFCPHCGASAEEKDKFCVICGELIHATAVCGACGEVVPIAAAFCPKCGVNFLEHPELSIQGVRLPTGTQPEAVVYTTEELEADNVDGPDVEPDEPIQAKKHIKIPRALQRALGMTEKSETHLPEGEPLDVDEEPEDAAQNSDEEAPLALSDDADDTHPPQFGRKKVRWRRRERKLGADSEEFTVDSPSASVDMDEDGESEDEQRKSLFRFLGRQKKVTEGQNRASILVLWAARRNAKNENKSLYERDESEEDDEQKRETSTKHGSGLFTGLKRQKKVDVSEEEARKEFEEKANYDGYYDDVHPLDYGETDEERGQLDIKSLVLLVAGLVIFCVVVIKLQAML